MTSPRWALAVAGVLVSGGPNYPEPSAPGWKDDKDVYKRIRDNNDVLRTLKKEEDLGMDKGILLDEEMKGLLMKREHREDIQRNFQREMEHGMMLQRARAVG